MRIRAVGVVLLAAVAAGCGGVDAAPATVGYVDPIDSGWETASLDERTGLCDLYASLTLTEMVERMRNTELDDASIDRFLELLERDCPAGPGTGG